MNSDRFTYVALVFLVLGVFTVATALASTSSYPTPAKEQYARQIAERMLQGERISQSKKAFAYPIIEQLIRARHPNSFISRTSATDDFGGPDGAGYRWMDDRETGGPTYSWIDISNGNLGPSGDDGSSAMVDLGFTFPFYGQTYTQVTISDNGWLSFDAAFANRPVSGGGYLSETVLPNTDTSLFGGAPRALIAPFWDDLISNNLRYQQVAGNFVVSWLQSSHWGAEEDTFDFQVILSPNGLIKMQYRSLVGELSSSTVGIQNEQGTIGLQIAYDTNPNNLLANNRAVVIYTLGRPESPIPANAALNVPTNTALRWRRAALATTYDVYFGTVNPPVTLVSSAQTDTFYVPTLAANTTYYWKVIAFNADRTQSSESAIWSFTTGTGSALPAPSNGAVEPSATNPTTSLTVTWQRNSTTETGFPITRSTDGETFTQIGVAPAGSTTYTDNNLIPGSQYWYHIHVQNASATSVNYAEANTWTNPVSASVPSVSLSGQGYYSIFINNLGEDLNGSNTQYKIQELNSTMWVLGDGSLGTDTPRLVGREGWNNYEVVNLSSGVNYLFAVTAVNGNGVAALAGPAASITTNDLNHGGPDAYGYRYITSNAVGGPTHNWIAPSTTAAQVSGWASNDGWATTDDGSAGPYPIGFTFPFYDTTYTQFYCGTNGRIQFGSRDPMSYWESTFPLVNFPAGIYFWNHDMSVESPTIVNYENLTNPNRLVITYSGFHALWPATATVDVQVVLRETGEFYVVYGQINNELIIDAAAIQDRNGTRGIQYAPPIPAANCTYMFYRLGQANDPLPTNLATNVPLNAILSWRPATAAINYDVLFDTENPPVATVSHHQTDTTYTATLSPGTTYYWQVIAYGNTDSTLVNPGPVWSFTTGTGNAPNAPSGGSIDNQSSTSSSLTVQWVDNSTNETGFPITRSVEGGPYEVLTTTAAGTTSYTNQGLNPCTRYGYRIYAQNGGLTSINYTSANGWTLPLSAGMPSLALSGLGFYTIAITGIGIDQNGPSTIYKVRETTTNRWVMPDGTLGTATPRQSSRNGWNNFVISGLTSGATYSFAVTAMNGNGVEASPGMSASITTADINHGGPDAFGYRYITSNAIGGPQYNWITPSAAATTVSGWVTNDGWATTDDGTAGPYPIGFTFHFYDTTYTEFYSGTNGRIQFGRRDPQSYWASEFPLLDFPAGIYFWNHDMSVDPPATITYENLANPTRMLITYSNLHALGSTDQTVNAQIVLYQTGIFDVVYGAINGNLMIDAAAIQDRMGTRGIQYAPPLPAANTTYRFYSLGQASSPIPADLATNVPQNVTLSWIPASAATTYSIKFDSENPPVAEIATAITATSFTVPSNLGANATYYWQVTSANDATTNPGPIWSFTTGTGIAPICPDSLRFETVTNTSAQLQWHDRSTTETGFAIYRSVSDTGFIHIFDVAANVTTASDTNLLPNTRYYYQVASKNGTIISTDRAATNSWTLATDPIVPATSNIGITSVFIEIRNDNIHPNPTYTQYAININNEWLQLNSRLGADTIWRTVEQWGAQASVIGLLANTDYVIRIMARNGNHVVTAFSPSLAFRTQGSFTLPFAQNFDIAQFPPPDWTLVNSDNLVTWDRYVRGTNGSAQMQFMNYWPSTGQLDELWSPPFRADSVSFVRVTFDWFYSSDWWQSFDTLDVYYTIDGGTTRSLVWRRMGNSNDSASNLRVTPGTGGDPGNPPPSAENWGHAEAWLPQTVIGQTSVQIGFISYNRNGPNLFVDNVQITGPSTVSASGLVHRDNDAPIAGATIRIHNQWETTTNAQGRWSITIPSGTYNMIVHKPCMYPLITYANQDFPGPDTVRFDDVLGSPEISVSPTSLECAVVHGDSISQTIILRNQGDYMLEYEASVTYPTDNSTLRLRPIQPLHPIQPDPRHPPVPVMGTREEKANYAHWVHANYPIRTSPEDNEWGRDEFGYIARDNQGSGATYNWEDISQTGAEVLRFPNGTRDDDDGWSNGFPIGFSMPFYGQMFDTLYISANGFITFRPYYDGCPYIGTLPDSFYQIAAYKTDNFHVVGASQYYYQTLTAPNRMVIQFNNVRYFDAQYQNNPAYSKTYQFVIYENGLVKIQYQSLGMMIADSTNRPVAGIDNEGPGGINIYSDSTFVNGLTNYCVEFNVNSLYSYVRIEPVEAQVEEGQLLEVGVTLSVPDTIPDGTILTANIIFSSNACTTITVPVTIIVHDSIMSAKNEVLPIAYKLHQNYPNPFNPSTSIRFDLKKPGMTRLTVYNALGQQVATLINSYLPAGYHSVKFRSDALATGVYFYRIESGSFTALKKMVLVK